MRILIALLIVSSVSIPTDALAQVSQPASLRDAVRLGQMVVVTEDSGRETAGVVREVTDVSLTLDHRVFDVSNVHAVRRTDPVGNGTWAGAGIGLGTTVALFVACDRYEFSEERGLCMAGAVTSGLLFVPVAAFIGRQMDRAIGNQELYRRTGAPITSTIVEPLWSAGGVGGKVSWSIRWPPRRATD